MDEIIKVCDGGQIFMKVDGQLFYSDDFGGRWTEIPPPVPSKQDDKGKVFCEDCAFICKPPGAPYEPHPESTCTAEAKNNKGYVVRTRYFVPCETINSDGLCDHWITNQVKL